MPQQFPRCQLIPQPGHQLQFLVDGEERLRWHFSRDVLRPFFYPLIGPAGVPLTRMGHPGAPNHDHHQSLWFAHADVDGVNFWANTGDNTGSIRQSSWLCYDDGDEHGAMAVRLEWRSRSDERPLLQQDLVALLRPLPDREWMLELQSSITPTGDTTRTINQSNFGLLALRVSKQLSVHFGGGKLTSSEGAENEAAGFGQYARWWDYSGPVKPHPDAGEEQPVWNGITYFDHPANPHHPAHWHVREDGWVGASLTRHQPITIREERPLRLRYLLYVHNGPYHSQNAGRVARAFATWPWYAIEKSSKKHQAYQVTPEQPPETQPHEDQD